LKENLTCGARVSVMGRERRRIEKPGAGVIILYEAAELNLSWTMVLVRHINKKYKYISIFSYYC